ncbi:MAG: 3TM-type holin [Kiritimatiellales bacterium]
MASTFSLNFDFGTIVSSITSFFDKRKFTEQERAELDLLLKQAELSLREKELAVAAEFAKRDATIAEAQSKVVQAEAGARWWLQGNWRPLTMIAFVIMLVARWFGFTPVHLSETEASQILDIVMVGLGVYTGGRSLEKIISAKGTKPK